MDRGHPCLHGQTPAGIIAEGHNNGISPDTWGVWDIYGEDANCDLGGPHSNPKIGTYEGTLRNAAIHAVSLPRYKTWGGGGYIQQTEIDHGACEVAGDDPVRAANERLARAREELAAATAHADEVCRKMNAQRSATDKLAPVIKTLTNDEINVAVEVFTKLIRDYTE